MRGKLRTESRSVELGDARTVGVLFKMEGGELRVRGGARHLLDAEFTYEMDSWRPEVSYEVRGNQGDLAVRQPSSAAAGEARYRWDAALSDDVPMELRVEMGAGDGELRLGSLQLSRLEVEHGAGNLTVDLAGAWEGDLVASVKGTVGTVTVRLPGDVGVVVRHRLAERGLIGGVSARG